MGKEIRFNPAKRLKEVREDGDTKEEREYVKRVNENVRLEKYSS